VEYEITNGVYNLLLNKTLALAMQQNLERVGGVRYTPEETEFARKIQATLPGKLPDISTAALVEPLEEVNFAGSTDVGDVSWNVPTVGVDAATWVPGTTPHTWQAVACGATDIGMKGMMVAAKALALMGIDLFTDPALLQKAREELTRCGGKTSPTNPSSATPGRPSNKRKPPSGRDHEKECDGRILPEPRRVIFLAIPNPKKVHFKQMFFFRLANNKIQEE
jgi:stage V sporulation protein SpoVS